MKNVLWVMVTLIAILTACIPLPSQVPLGEWKNTLGSTLKITDCDSLTGAIKGYYVSPTGTEGNSYPLVGWAHATPKADGGDNVTVLSFSVRWDEYGSITTWSGHFKPDDLVITTLWLLVRSQSKLPYEHFLTGSDVFNSFHPTVTEEKKEVEDK